MKIPNRNGEWILITKEIPVEYYIQPLSIFFAIPSELFWKGEMRLENFGWASEMRKEIHFAMGKRSKEEMLELLELYIRGNKIPPSLKKKLDTIGNIKEVSEELEYSMRIRTREGEVKIMPGEYKIVSLKDYLDPVKDGHAFIKWLNRSSVKLSSKLADQIFYLRSRGIDFVEAIMMISANINTMNGFYIELHRKYVKQFFRDFDRIDAKRVSYEERMYLLEHA